MDSAWLQAGFAEMGDLRLTSYAASHHWGERSRGR